MKAISLHQPWASLVMAGEKQIETRSWKPPASVIGKRVLIHAAKRVDPCATCEPFVGALPETIPVGALLGSVWVEGAWRIDRPTDADRLIEAMGAKHEREFGDFSLGRWMWMLRSPSSFREPIPYNGAQRFFNFRLSMPDGGRQHDN